MPKKSAAPFSPLRLISPGLLAVAFVLFFLPWAELILVPPKSKFKDIPKETLQEIEKKTGKDPTKPRSFFSQSGLQIATADYSIVDPDLKKAADKPSERDDTPLAKEKEKYTAPLLFLYPVLLLAGIGCAFVPMPPMPRRLAVAGCCGFAFLFVGGYAAFGFPVDNEIKKEYEKQKEAMKEVQKKFEELQKKAGGTVKAEKIEMEMPFRYAYQFSLYLALLLLLGAAGTAFIDGDTGGGRVKYGRKNRRDYDEDDEDDEDDYDDRPRRRSRRDDDDEDDRPRRKKAMSLDEDEDDRPRKKSRRDDDEDEDDRPRKKSRRDEDEEEPPRKKKPAAPAFELPPEPLPPPTAPAGPAAPNPFAFDDEPAPKKKPRRRDEEEDDEDDRPRKRRRRDED